jgi:hypothetical protein
VPSRNDGIAFSAIGGCSCRILSASRREAVMAQNVPEWLEYLKVGISALTPIATGFIGWIVLSLGRRIEHGKQLNQALLNKRLSLFDEIAPQLNDIYCFYLGVGNWSDFNPTEIIKRKRAIDRVLHVNRYLFDETLTEQYRNFQDAYFELFVEVGQPAKLRLDVRFLRRQIGTALKDEWMSSISSDTGIVDEQREAYAALMDALAKEIRGER